MEMEDKPVAEAVAPAPKRRPWGKIAGFSVLGVLLLILVFTGIIYVTLPNVEEVRERNPKETAIMRHREAQFKEKGKKLRRIHYWAPLSRISPLLIQAVLISEDDKFFQHEGFDWEEMREAMEKNLDRKQVVRGGSTITQQLAKNLYLRPARTPWRKLQEALIARKLEKTLSKRRILELYLNVIEWGDGLYGAEAAARTCFGKAAAELTPAEAIRLVSVIINPHRYSAVSNASKRMRNKRLLLAQRMYQRELFDEPTFQSLCEDFSQ